MEALDGFQGVRDVQVDFSDDRFDITYNPAEASPGDFLGAIRELDYDPEVVTSTSIGGKDSVTSIDPEVLPAEISKVFAEARRAEKPILFRFSGPG